MRMNEIVNDSLSSQTIPAWIKIENAISNNLEHFENQRKFCAYCGQKEDLKDKNSSHLIFGRCYGCQMVYYCSQEHQQADWLEHHMPKCAELEWVALGELIQSIPANPALTNLGMYWPENYIPHTWTDWFEIRPDLIEMAKKTAFVLEENQQLKFVLNKFNRREPTSSDLMDGLLAAVTDSITYALTIGNCLIKTGINPNLKPVCIHLLHPPIELIDDLDSLWNTFNSSSEICEHIDQFEIDSLIKKKFYELCNMFPSNKGIEIVFISTATLIDSKQRQIVLDWSKLLKPPFMKTQLHKSLPFNDKNLYISAWQGSYSNYIKYACQIEGYSHPDLIVSFHPGFTSSPQKLINDWTDDLKIILTNSFPCLFTFYDRDEKEKAFNILNAFQSNFLCAEANQFSSLMFKQMHNKPNDVYATNSFLIVIKGFNTCESDSRYHYLVNELTTKERNKCINDYLSFHHMNSHQIQMSKQINDQQSLNSLCQSNSIFQNDACIQTVGLEEPENASLRHVNGKIQINKSLSSIYSKTIKTTKNETLTQKSQQSNLPLLDYSIKDFTSKYYTGQSINEVNFRPSNFLTNLNYNNIYYQHYLPINDNFYRNYNDVLIKSNQEKLEETSFQLPIAPSIQTRSQIKNDITNSSITSNTHLPPPLKPRIINNCTNLANETCAKNDILDFSTAPVTKPRLRPTRIYDKFVNNLTTNHNSNETKNQQQEIHNPLPKPRNSLHINESNSSCKIDNDVSKQEQLSFKASLLKKSAQKKESSKVNNSNFYLPTSPLESSTSSPCSSTSTLSNSISMSSSFPSTEDQKYSPSKTNSSFVNQMKNIFESQQNSQHLQIDLKKRQTSNVEDSKKPTSPDHIINEQDIKNITKIEDNLQDKNDQEANNMNNKNEITESEYVNVSNQFLSFLRQQHLESNQHRSSPPLSPPPLPPTSPISSPPIASSSISFKQETIPLTLSQFKSTNDKLVSQIISTQSPLNTNLTTTTTTMTTTTTTATTITNQILSSSLSSNRLMSSTSSNNQTSIRSSSKSEFRLLNMNNVSITNHSDKSTTTLSGKSLSSLSQSNNNLNLNNRVILSHIPDSVDEVQLQYEGQRRVVVPGYMTSADIIRNMLLNNHEKTASDGFDPSKAPIIIKRESASQLTLKEKLLMQNKSENLIDHSRKPIIASNCLSFQTEILQQETEAHKQKNYQLSKIDCDDELDKKFARSRTKSVSSVMAFDLQNNQSTKIIDIDLDCNETISTSQLKASLSIEPQSKPLIINQYPDVNNSLNEENEKKVRLSLRNKVENVTESNSTSVNDENLHLNFHRQSVTGSFDPNDFDSFDEDEANLSYLKSIEVKNQIQIEPMEKIRQTALLQQQLDEDREKQQANLVEFDPNDFDSFNEDEDEPEQQLKSCQPSNLPVIQSSNNTNNETTTFNDFKTNRDKIEAIFKNNKPKKDDFNEVKQENESNKILEPSPIENLPLAIMPISQESSCLLDKSNKQSSGSNFFRSAFDRISNRSKTKTGYKARSSSVPLRTIVNTSLELAVTETDKQSAPQPQPPPPPPPLLAQPPQPQQRKLSTQNSNTVESKSTVIPNMKTLQLMNKMQTEFDEKQKRRKQRREKKELETEKLPPKSPKASDRKFLSSIMNTFFSSTTNVNETTESSTNESKLQKNDSKRLSLRKLKAKDKAKKKYDSGDEQCTEKETSSNYSLNLISENYNDYEEQIKFTVQQFPRSSSFDTGSLTRLTSLNFKQQSIGVASINSRFGKIKNESDKPKEENNKENLMKQLKAELDEEIKDRRMIELKNNIIYGNCNSAGGSTSSASSVSSSNRRSLKCSQDVSSNKNRKIRSKSVTFLDEISTDDEVISMNNSPQISNMSNYEPNTNSQYLQPNQKLNYLNNNNQEVNSYCTPSSTRKAKISNGDLRMMCGALTGVGPIRSIMKKSSTDLSLTLNSPSTSKSNSYETNHNANQLPCIQLIDEFNNYEINAEQHQQILCMKQEKDQQKSRINQNVIVPKRRDVIRSDL